MKIEILDDDDDKNEDGTVRKEKQRGLVTMMDGGESDEKKDEENKGTNGGGNNRKADDEGKGNDEDIDDGDVPSPFLTTTDILKSLNKSIHETMMGSVATDPSGRGYVLNDSDKGNENVAAGGGGGGEQREEYFEMQTKLPDGSTRKATEAELKAADMEAKIQQVAKYVSELDTVREKLDFVDDHRDTGNRMYRREQYRDAIDVYLTCITAIPLRHNGNIFGAGNNSNKNNKNDVDEGQQKQRQQKKKAFHDCDEDDDEDYEEKTKKKPCPEPTEEEQREAVLLFYKVMNNLAQSSLQLRWFHKTEQFCNLAMDHERDEQRRDERDAASKKNDENDDDDACGDAPKTTEEEILLQRAKLYYKRGKARRLRGSYGESKWDLERATELLERRQRRRDDAGGSAAATANTTAAATEKEGYRGSAMRSAEGRTVQRELQLLAKAVEEAKRNKERQQRAMQKLMNRIHDDGDDGGGDGDGDAKKNDDHDQDDGAEKGENSTRTAERTRVGDRYAEEGPRGLYDDKHGTDGADRARTRKFSRLRSPSYGKQKTEDASDKDDGSVQGNGGRRNKKDPSSPFTQYWRTYLYICGRVAQRILDLIGDENDGENDDDDDIREDKDLITTYRKAVAKGRYGRTRRGVDDIENDDVVDDYYNDGGGGRMKLD